MLGPHSLLPNSGAPILLRAGCRVFKSVDDVGLVEEALRLNPTVTCIIRFTNPHLTAESLMHLTSLDAALFWANSYQETYDRNRTTLLNPRVYIEGPNEPVFKIDNRDDIESLRWYSEFEFHRTNILAQFGFRSCLLNFSMGYPAIESWRVLNSGLFRAQELGGLIGIHGYSSHSLLSQPELTLRHRPIRAELTAMGFGNIPIVYTEFGLLEYKSVMGDSQYASELIAWSNEVRNDPGLLGATIFTFGSNNSAWDGYNVSDTSIPQALADHIRATPPTPPPPEEPPMPDFKIGDLVKVIKSALRARLAPGIDQPTLRVMPIESVGVVTQPPVLKDGIPWVGLEYDDRLTEFSSGNFLEVITPTPEPPPPTPSGNLLINPDMYTDGVHTLPGHDNMQVGNGWDFGWLDQLDPRIDRQDPFAPWLQPETKFRSDDGRRDTEILPASELELYLTALIRIVFHVFKLFGIQWWELRQAIDLPPGEYEFGCELYPDLYTGHHQFVTNERIAGEWRLNVSGQPTLAFDDGGTPPLGQDERIYFGHWRRLSRRFTHLGGAVTVGLEFRVRWGIEHAGAFIRDMKLVRV